MSYENTTDCTLFREMSTLFIKTNHDFLEKLDPTPWVGSSVFSMATNFLCRRVVIGLTFVVVHGFNFCFLNWHRCMHNSLITKEWWPMFVQQSKAHANSNIECSKAFSCFDSLFVKATEFRAQNQCTTYNTTILLWRHLQSCHSIEKQEIALPLELLQHGNWENWFFEHCLQNCTQWNWENEKIEPHSQWEFLLWFAGCFVEMKNHIALQLTENDTQLLEFPVFGKAENFTSVSELANFDILFHMATPIHQTTSSVWFILSCLSVTQKFIFWGDSWWCLSHWRPFQAQKNIIIFQNEWCSEFLRRSEAL